MRFTEVMQRRRQLEKAVDAQPLYQRIVLGIGLGLLVYMVYFLFMARSLELSSAALTTQIANTQQKIQSLKTEIQFLSENSETSSLKNEIATVNDSLKIYQDTIIPVDKMDEMLRDLIGRNGHVSLIGLQTLSDQVVSTESIEHLYSGTLTEYRVRLELKSTYKQTLQFLHSVEQGAWRVFWDSLDYRVTQYPEAIVTLDVHTLKGES